MVQRSGFGFGVSFCAAFEDGHWSMATGMVGRIVIRYHVISLP